MRWKVKRYIVEEFIVEAETKEQALQSDFKDPSIVKVLKETIRKAK